MIIEMSMNAGHSLDPHTEFNNINQVQAHLIVTVRGICNLGRYVEPGSKEGDG